MLAKTPSFTFDELNEAFLYSPETGYFAWRKSRPRCTPGRRTGRVKKSGKNKAYGPYVVLRYMGKEIYAHRVAFMLMTGCWPAPNQFVDHINGDGTNNSWSNLRLVTTSINAQNRKSVTQGKKCTSLLGVTFHKPTDKYQASINTRYIGLFDTEREAHAAYLAEKAKVHEGFIAARYLEAA